jgi:hypothetical protein
MAGANSNSFQHALVVKDLAALAIVHIAELDFGVVCWVISANAAFTLTGTPNSPPDGVNVVAPVVQAAVGKPGAAWEKGTGGGGSSGLDGVTLAQLATITGNDASSIEYVFDTKTFYRWFPADATPPNGFTVVAAPGGNWKLEGSIVYLAPLGGGADDWPRVIFFANALAYKGAVQMLSGSGPFLCKSVTQIASGAWIIGGPGVTVISSLTPTGGPGGFANSVFYSDKTNGNATTLSATPTIGKTTIQTLANFAAGTTVVVSRSGLVGQSFIVLGSSGGGPFTLALDDTVEYSFQAGDPVTAVTRPSDILIDSNNMVVTGTGDRCVEFVCAQRCTVKNLIVSRSSGSFTSIVCSFDVAGRDNIFERVNVDGGGVSAACIAMESGVREKIVSCRAAFSGQLSTNLGIIAISSAYGLISDCEIQNCGSGLFLAYSDPTDVDACRHMQIANIQSENNSNYGVVQAGGTNNQYVNISADSNSLSGVAFDVSGFGQAPTATLANVNCAANAGPHGGFYMAGAGGRVGVSGLVCDGNTGAGIQMFGDGSILTVDDYRATDNAGGPWAIDIGAGACTLSITDGYVRKTTNAGVLQGAPSSDTCYVALNDYTAELVSGAGVTALVDFQCSGTLVHRGCRLKGAVQYGVFAAHAPKTPHIIDGGSNAFAAATVAAYQFDASTLANFGSFTANGVTPVPVTGIFRADQAITISFQSLGGTQGAQPVISAKAANSFSSKATAGDTSLYNWATAP